MAGLLLLTGQLETDRMAGLTVLARTPLGLDAIRANKRERTMVHVLLVVGFQIRAAGELELDFVHIAARFVRIRG